MPTPKLSPPALPMSPAGIYAYHRRYLFAPRWPGLAPRSEGPRTTLIWPRFAGTYQTPVAKMRQASLVDQVRADYAARKPDAEKARRARRLANRAARREVRRGRR